MSSTKNHQDPLVEFVSEFTFEAFDLVTQIQQAYAERSMVREEDEAENYEIIEEIEDQTKIAELALACMERAEELGKDEEVLKAYTRFRTVQDRLVRNEHTPEHIRKEMREREQRATRCLIRLRNRAADRNKRERERERERGR